MKPLCFIRSLITSIDSPYEFLYFRTLINIFWPLFQKVHFCIADYEKLPLLNTHVDNLMASLKEALAELVPEFGFIRCSSAFQYDQPVLTRKIKQFVK